MAVALDPLYNSIWSYDQATGLIQVCVRVFQLTYVDSMHMLGSFIFFFQKAKKYCETLIKTEDIVNDSV